MSLIGWREEISGPLRQVTPTVDMELELCTCPVDQSGAPCTHQAAVVQNFNNTSINFLPTTDEMRAELLKITKGNHFFTAYVVTH